MKNTSRSPFPQEPKTLSLSQLWCILEQSIEVPNLMSVAGKCEFNNNADQFWIQNGTIRLTFKPSPHADIQHGDWVALKFSREALRAFKKSSTSFCKEVLLEVEAFASIEKLDLGQSRELHSDFVERPSESKILRRRFNDYSFWSSFIRSVRSFFWQRYFLEATTPSLVVNPGMEPELEPFSVVWRQGQRKQNYFLPTSPELGLKKLLSLGFTDIFEIKTVYRNEEKTEIHEPEFQMLEWYRGFGDLKTIERDLVDLLNHIGREAFKRDQNIVDRVDVYTVAECFQKYLGLSLNPHTDRDTLWSWANDLALKPSAEFDWNDLFHLIWVAKIEPQLPQNPFILKKYPRSQAALACIDDDGWADRFEFYWCGIEIANAFNELTDPIEQRTRFERDQKLRLKYGRTPLPIDEDFMKALERGIPHTGGIALGLDRLFHCFCESYGEKAEL